MTFPPPTEPAGPEFVTFLQRPPTEWSLTPAFSRPSAAAMLKYPPTHQLLLAEHLAPSVAQRATFEQKPKEEDP